MKVLLILITLITATIHCWAEENHEVIWETEQIGGLNEVEISPLGEVFYNTKDSIVQVRSVETGELIDEILFPNTTRLDAISISADGRYMAVSGEPKYIIIYDLVLEREVKRLTAIVWEEEEFGENVKYEAEKWVCSSISPDGTIVTGVAITDAGVKKSSLIVIDIQSELILYESRRILYDRNIQKPDNYEWISSEFSPDGKYIVSQLDYDFYHGDESDSIYIYDANTLEVYDVVLNKYWDSRQAININPNSKNFIYHGNNNDNLYEIYQFNERKSQEVLNLYLWTFTFLRNSDHIIYGHDNGLSTFDFKNKINIYDYKLVTNVFTTSLDDSKLFANYHGHIYCLKTFLYQTNIEDNQNIETTTSPNPTKGVVHFSLDCTEPELVYSIYSSVGALLANDIKVKQGRDVSIDFSTYPTGVYFVSFLCDGELKTYKTIKEG
ncbi:MAG: T9SS type A sorting domain-containing protein [Chlorobiota bacterium]